MSENKPRNIIYVFADQLRYDALGCNGGKHAVTPNLDALAASSANLTNAVSGHPVCAPYRASLFTGKYTCAQDGTGMYVNELRINPRHETLAKVLTKNGFETSYIGKWHLYANVFNDHQNPESSFIPRGENRLGFDGTFLGYNFHHQYYAPKAYYHAESKDKIPVQGFEPDAQTDLAIGELDRLSAQGKPFALFLSYGTPHDPWSTDNVPQKYLDNFKDVDFGKAPNYSKHNDKYADLWARFLPFERKKLNSWQQVYAAMVQNLDDNVGRLWAHIQELGIADDTLFVFTSDHGELFGAHGRRAKNIFYDEAVHVPFLVKWGDRFNGRPDFCLNSVDIMPTLLSLTGLPVPATVQGKSLADCLTGVATCDKGCLLTGAGATAIWGDGFEWRGIRNKQYTYATYRRDGKEFLFDNLHDPYQMKNLAEDAAHKDTLLTLKAEMQAEMERVGDKFERASYYKKNCVTRDRCAK